MGRRRPSTHSQTRNPRKSRVSAAPPNGPVYADALHGSVYTAPQLIRAILIGRSSSWADTRERKQVETVDDHLIEALTFLSAAAIAVLTRWIWLRLMVVALLTLWTLFFIDQGFGAITRSLISASDLRSLIDDPSKTKLDVWGACTHAVREKVAFQTPRLQLYLGAMTIIAIFSRPVRRKPASTKSEE